MKKDKILLNVNILDDVQDYIKLGITNFLFPLENYSIGYTCFSLKEIESVKFASYILVNRLLTDEDIDEFLKLDIPSNVKGFIIEDIGLYYALKNTTYELINFQNHLNNNYKTVNYWLEHFDSLLLSTDITGEEIDEILARAKKPLILNTVGYPMIMYSRRTLVSNFYQNLNEVPKIEENIYIPNTDNVFKFKESPYGTAVFDTKLIDIRDFAKNIDDNKIKFYLINTEFLSKDDVLKILNGETLEGTSNGFLEKKTIYKVGDIK